VQIKNKVYIVTGGGNGIGRELVLNLLGKGAIVAAVDIDEAGLKETVELSGDLSDNLSTHILDLTDREAVEALPKEIFARHGAVDGLINNAGIIQPFVKTVDLAFSDIERVMNINFYGLVNMTKVFLPYLLKRPEGHIVNVSSMGGFLPVPGQGVYGASKAAVKLFTESLYAELLNTNVHVTVVYPGSIGTDIAKNSGVRMDQMSDEEMQESMQNTLSPSEAAEIIVKGIKKDKFRILVGSDAKFMDFLYRLAPKLATKTIVKQMGSLLGE
jgi:short-subunit dehydrogenase